jgi:hypothetical protein
VGGSDLSTHESALRSGGQRRLGGRVNPTDFAAVAGADARAAAYSCMAFIVSSIRTRSERTISPCFLIYYSGYSVESVSLILLVLGVDIDMLSKGNFATTLSRSIGVGERSSNGLGLELMIKRAASLCRPSSNSTGTRQSYPRLV